MREKVFSVVVKMDKDSVPILFYFNAVFNSEKQRWVNHALEGYTHTEGHFVCDLEYYRRCRKPSTSAEVKACDELFARYSQGLAMKRCSRFSKRDKGLP